PGELPLGLGRVLLERMPLGIILVSTRGNVLFLNPTARAIFGRLGDVGFPVEALRAPRLLEAIEDVRENRASVEAEFSLQRASALHLCSHIVSLSHEAVMAGAPGRSEDPPDVLIAIEDRTQARKTDELHRDFVANASHELKTPLAALSGGIETLLGHGHDDPDARARFLPMMETQTERMRHLVEDLLSLNRIELNERSQPREAQPINRIVWEVADTLRSMAQAEGSTITCLAPSDQPLVPGAREELSQVFMNLIENALKYGGPGTNVTVRMQVGGGQRAGMIGIAVSDDGPGIAREHLPRLTERFYRVSVSRSREKGGTGLGLAIVKHVISRHRGVLDIESTPSVGSSFTVWLPLHADSTAPTALLGEERAAS
ncbi:MAG: ATP-binding protein, partial [Pseudomonadota bacterium]